MRNHPYLKAYMAGITVPTLFLLVVLSTLIALRQHRVSLEPFAVLPMALVPNTWGVWNTLRVACAPARRIPLGLYGALLAVWLPVVGYGVARLLGFEPPAFPPSVAAAAWLAATIVYGLAWKLLVGFLNELLGVHA